MVVAPDSQKAALQIKRWVAGRPFQPSAYALGGLELFSREAVAAAKGAVTGLGLSAAASYAGRGLRFNIVAPGLVQTPMTEKVTGRETARRASTDLHPLGRLGEPEDVAAMISLLLDPAQSWVTGQIFGVDGGLSTLRPLPRRTPIPAKSSS